MTTSNQPENLNTNPAHDLGQISIQTLLNHIAEERNWIEHEEPACADQGLYYAGQQDMLDRITVFLMARSNQAPKRYVVVEHPGTEREFQVFAANTYRDCHLWMNRHYTDDHCPADIMVQLPDGSLSTEI